MKLISILCLPALLLAGAASACDLCSVYRASNAQGGSSPGLVFTVSEQFIPFRTVLYNGAELNFPNADYLDGSITHLVPGYNFSPRFGVSLNVPVVSRSFRRTDVRYSLTGPPVFQTEQGTVSGLGDMSLIGRLAVIQKTEMDHGIVLNVLAGVRFPTGDTDRLKDEVGQARIFEALSPSVPHNDPLSHSTASVHQHNLSPGSGSFDGIFGVTLNTRWQQWFFNSQFQYYLHTEGESTFQYGDELMVSGGPGAYILRGKKHTLSLQLNAAYETVARDRLIGKLSNRTGSTAWYLGPLVSFTWGEHFSANAGVDVPVEIAANGFQNVPDYRVHGGLTWRF